MTEDRCIVCGEIVPEGRMVCPNCENRHIESPCRPDCERRSATCHSSCHAWLEYEMVKQTMYAKPKTDSMTIARWRGVVRSERYHKKGRGLT